MKATLFYQHGGPEVLQYTDFPTPEPKPSEALVRLRAAALDSAFPLQEAALAQERLWAGKNFGKITLDIG